MPQKSVMFDLEPRIMSVSELMDHQLIGLKKDRGLYCSEDFLKQELHPDSSDKWHFPRTRGNKLDENKYLSL